MWLVQFAMVTKQKKGESSHQRTHLSQNPNHSHDMTIGDTHQAFPTVADWTLKLRAKNK